MFSALGDWLDQPDSGGSEDFAAPLCLRFRNAYLLDAFITEQMPNDLVPSIDIEDIDYEPQAFIEPLLLNHGDWFEVQAFTNGAPDEFFVEGRIAGVPKFRDRARVRAHRFRIARYLVPIVAFALIVWISSLLSTLGVENVTAGAALVGALLAAVSAWIARNSTTTD